MSHSHAIVWMDSKEAHVFQFNAEDVEKQRIVAQLPFRKIHHKAGVIGAGHVHLDHHNCLEVLIVRGKASVIRKIADELIAAKGVKHGKLTVTTTGKDLPG